MMGKRRRSKAFDKRKARMVDPGPDASGRFGVSPYHLQHGHIVEDAPRELRATPDSTFPKRVATQRMIDRYRAHGHITETEWRGGNALWEAWCTLGLNARVTAGYDPDAVRTAATPDGMIAKKLDGVMEYLALIDAVPYRLRGCVVHVVIVDGSASDWARMRGYGRSDSERRGMERLRSGLSALTHRLGY